MLTQMQNAFINAAVSSSKSLDWPGQKTTVRTFKKQFIASVTMAADRIKIRPGVEHARAK